MIVHLGLNYSTVPVWVRGRFAFNAESCEQTLRRLREEGLASEGVLISTCNRVELYVAAEDGNRIEMESLLRFLSRERGIEYSLELKGCFYFHTQQETLKHLFEVVSGLDSMALGETEISGQVKNAYELALKGHFTGRLLNKVFQEAFRTAKQIRSETDIQKGHISVANVAVELAEKIFSDLNEHDVLVLGAGDTSEKTAKAILSRRGNSRLYIANRTLERALALAEKLGGRAVGFQSWPEELPSLGVIISSTAATEYILTQEQVQKYMQGRLSQPLLLIDIAVPRDIDPQADSLENVYLYNIDDLQAIASKSLRLREQQIHLCRELVQRRVREFTEAQERADEYRGKIRNFIPVNSIGADHGKD